MARVPQNIQDAMAKDGVPEHQNHSKYRLEEIETHSEERELQLRKADNRWGSGAFGASRSGGRTHYGIDIAAAPGSPIYALRGGAYTRQNQPYAGDARYTGMDIKEADGNINKYFYVTPLISIGTAVSKGDLIGRAQDIAAKYPGMDNHFHFEVRNGGKALNPFELLPDYVFR